MKTKKHNGEIKVLGIDLAKSSFQLHGVDEAGRSVLRKKVSRQRLPALMANMPGCRIGMEACGTAHYWARLFRQFGHDVRLMAPQFVKPYVKSNKSDALDAEAICEAVQRPNMRFVAIKESGQQDIQSLHRMRSLAIKQRTQLVNQIRGLLLEYGIEIARGRAHVRQSVPEILEDAENGLSDDFREELSDLYPALVHLDERIEKYDAKIDRIAAENKQARHLLTIPGIGAKGATALVAAVGDGRAFKNGREMAAWLGLVPRQHSTGGRERLLGISKRGDAYLRTLLIHGGRSVARFAERKEDRRSRWITHLEKRRGMNITAVAIANKNIRTAWALLTGAVDYQPVLGSAPSEASFRG